LAETKIKTQFQLTIQA